MSVHTLHLIIVFALVATVFTAFLREWASPDLVALSAMGVLLVTGILSADETLAVFSNSAPVVIGCMFVLSAGLERTGAIDSLARVFMRVAGKNERRAQLALALLALPLSAVVNHMPVVVVFVPVVLALARNTDLKASRLLIPLSYFSILGGTCTLIGTSTNLLVSGIAHRRGLAPFGMFEITPLGITYAVVGVAYLLIFARKLLPYRESLAALIGGGMPRLFLTQAVISNASPLVGKTIAETPLARLREARIIDVVRDGERLETPLGNFRLVAGTSCCSRAQSPESRESRKCPVCFSNRKPSSALRSPANAKPSSWKESSGAAPPFSARHSVTSISGSVTASTSWPSIAREKTCANISKMLSWPLATPFLCKARPREFIASCKSATSSV